MIRIAAPTDRAYLSLLAERIALEAGVDPATVTVDLHVDHIEVRGVDDEPLVQRLADEHAGKPPADPVVTAEDVLAAIRELASEGAEVESRINERAAQKAQERTG